MSFIDLAPNFVLNNTAISDGDAITLSIGSNTNSSPQQALKPNSGSVRLFTNSDFTGGGGIFTQNNGDVSQGYGGENGPGSWIVGGNTIAVFYSQRGFSGNSRTYTSGQRVVAPAPYLSFRLSSYIQPQTILTNYINSDAYSFNPKQASDPIRWEFTNHSIKPGLTEYDNIIASYSPGDRMDSGFTQLDYYNGTEISKNDVVACSNLAKVQRQYTNYNAAVPNQGDNINQVLNADNYESYSSLADTPTQNNITLYVEIHGRFIALRGINGKYLHTLPRQQIADTSYNNGGAKEVPSNYVLTFSSIPSVRWSAQYSLYGKTDSNQVILLNRLSKTCITLQPSTYTVASTSKLLNGVADYNMLYRIAATWYNNVTQQRCKFIDTYTQYFYRLLGSTLLADAQQSSDCVFTLNNLSKKTTTLGCDPLNPTAVCLTNGYDANAFQRLCSQGDMMSTPRCQNWANNKEDDAEAIVVAYADRYPNDTTFGGCLNLWDLREIADWFSTFSPPVSLLPKCSAPTCSTARNPNVYMTTEIQNQKCEIQICNQPITVLGSITNSNLAIKQTCNNVINDNTTGGVSVPPPSLSDKILQSLLDFGNDVINNLINVQAHLNFTTVASSFLIAIVCIILLSLFIVLDTSWLIGITIGLTISAFLLLYND